MSPRCRRACRCAESRPANSAASALPVCAYGTLPEALRGVFMKFDIGEFLLTSVDNFVFGSVWV
jgi:hypothetical protein